MRRALATVALAALVLLDVALVVLAVRHGNGEAVALAPAPAASTPPAPLVTPTGTSSPSPDEQPTAAAWSGRVLLAAGPDGRVLRATAGGCPDGEAVVEMSTDGGATFTSLRLDPAPRTVVGLDPGSPAPTVALAGADCEPAALAETPSGEWQETRDEVWHLPVSDDASPAERVHAPTGWVDLPCVPKALSSTGAVRVLCDDDRIVGTGDGGESWVVLGRLPNGVDLAFTTPGSGLGLRSTPRCRATLAATEDGGTTWRRLGCLGQGEPQAITLAGTSAYAMVEGALLASSDGGRTWSR